MRAPIVDDKGTAPRRNNHLPLLGSGLWETSYASWNNGKQLPQFPYGLSILDSDL